MERASPALGLADELHRLVPRTGHRRWLLGHQGGLVHRLGKAWTHPHLLLNSGTLGLLQDLREEVVVLLRVGLLLLLLLLLHECRWGRWWRSRAAPERRLLGPEVHPAARVMLVNEPCVPVGTVHGERRVVDEVLRELDR